MGNEETETPSKLPKSSSAQEQPPADSPATVFPDWASFQAYYNSGGTPQIPPPAFFHSPVASSPQAHPYIWGPHMVPPYGATPPPFVAMYPRGGLYAHPSIPAGSHPYGPYMVPSSNGTAEASISTAGGGEVEGKSGEEKGKSPLKRSKGSLGSLSMLTGKGSETGKASGASANGGLSQSGESGSEGSSEGSDASSQNGSQQKLSSEKGSVHAFAQNGGTASPPTHTMLNPSMVMAMPPNGISGPTTNLNIGMDYWGGQAPNPVATSRAKLPVVLGTASMVPSSQIGSRDGVSPELWIQDERELKRQRRKQSNRESARRSRLRKQAECEELAQRVQTLTEENSSLREELECLREKRENLGSENVSLSEKLQNIQGRDLGVDSINGHPDPIPQTEADI